MSELTDLIEETKNFPPFPHPNEVQNWDAMTYSQLGGDLQYWQASYPNDPGRPFSSLPWSMRQRLMESYAQFVLDATMQRGEGRSSRMRLVMWNEAKERLRWFAEVSRK